jgi:20S proteasome alpha/beta subunit
LTLVLALRCREGAVIAADSKVTYRALGGRVERATRATKLIQHQGLLWGWAGAEAAHQRFTLTATNNPLIRSGTARSAIQDALDEAARHALSKFDGPVMDLEVLATWWSAAAGKALILKLVTPTGAVLSSWVDELTNVEMLGSAHARALASHALLSMGFGDFQGVGLEEAKTIAHKLIADVAASTDDVGEPVLIGSVTAAGVQVLDTADVEGVRDSAGRFTSDIRSLVSTELLPADTRTADEGVGPPDS